jgi:hypothetical protein
MENVQIPSNRLCCPLDINQEYNLFFSLVDYRNNLFTSNDPNKIMEFYDSFENRDQLIQWMRERPKGSSYIHEVSGDKDIIVVIPTADFNGKYAKECRENIFRGLHIVFVESGRDNFYFNYAHNCNVGIKKAMEYNPKWIVVSNDDVVKRDSIEKLRDGLKNIDETEKLFVFISESSYHSTFVLLSKPTLRRKIVLSIAGKWNRALLRVEKRFEIKVTFGGVHSISRFIYSNKKKIRFGGSFMVLNNSLVEKLEFNIFDETFINGTEDIFLSYKLLEQKIKSHEIAFSIGSIIGGTLGPYNIVRRLRGEVNRAYMSHIMRL